MGTRSVFFILKKCGDEANNFSFKMCVNKVIMVYIRKRKGTKSVVTWSVSLTFTSVRTLGQCALYSKLCVQHQCSFKALGHGQYTLHSKRMGTKLVSFIFERYWDKISLLYIIKTRSVQTTKSPARQLFSFYII